MDENPAYASPNVVGIRGCHPLLEGFVWGTLAATTLLTARRSSVLLPAPRCCCLLCCAYQCFVSFFALVCPSVFVVAAVVRFFGGCFAVVAAWVDAWPPRRFGLHAHSATKRVMALVTDALP